MAGTVAELLVKLGVRLDGSVKAEDGLRKLKKRAGEFGDEADRTSAKTKRLAAAAGRTLVKGVALGAAAIAAYGAALGKLVLDKADAIDKTNKLSTTLGVGVEELQRLEFAAGQSGASTEQLAMGLKFLNKGMLDAKEGGGKPLTDALGDLGLKVGELDKLSHTQKLGLIGDRLNEIEDGAERSAMAARVLGEEAGPGLASLLANGTDGLTQLTNAARGVLSQEDADRASEMQDRIGELTNTVDAFTTKIAVELMPTVTDWIETAQRWYDENEEIISQNFGATVQFVVDVVKLLGSTTGDILDTLGALRSALGLAGDEATRLKDAFDLIVWVLKQATSPIKNVKILLGELAYVAEQFGIVSTEAANDFNRSMGNIESSSGALDRTADKYRDLAEAADQSRRAIASHKLATALYGPDATTPLSLDEIERAKKKIEAERTGRTRTRTLNRASRAAGKPKKEKKEKEKPNPVTLEDLRRRLLTGDMSALSENLGMLSSSKASVADVKPSVVIHHTDNSTHTDVHVNRVDISVDGSKDPAATGQAVRGALLRSAVQDQILRDNAKTARTVLSPVVR